ncbi:hypothetical protein CEUSTIGMA_g1963.t1 [Chlamydomonas eustigma]|uniref:Protein kinase domain-containing protein n=1 Tax=Chlamydomonas eustigma TaxID=1157962 RepID=A0A250WUK6_9CHLO|nr:hypothetical protein CEUSTIGMA_g1963.t1 [Chlamydomonas eustigma]|eukprot:GAX74514.1 hypothetical protein CEUSTIGMA_g1963.t1 [Chlamydomonas eustigma]
MEVQRAHARLMQEKERAEAVLQHQYELIDCLSWVSEVGIMSAAGDRSATQLINCVQKQVIGNSLQEGNNKKSELTLVKQIGEGLSGWAYEGLWNNRPVAVVAVKTMVLPIHMNGAAKKERMAIMEAAISTSLKHPNIDVQTYTYTLTRLLSESSPVLVHSLESFLRPLQTMSWDPPETSFRLSLRAVQTHLLPVTAASQQKVQVVLELCEWGSLREALSLGVFIGDDGNVNYLAVLDTAAEISRGIASKILHADLKSMNVLLQGSMDNPRSLVAKIADFGLSLKNSQADTHVSNISHGTLFHMAPEVLLDGHHSNAADV